MCASGRRESRDHFGIFGHSYGKKPSYPLKSSAISRMLVFTGKVDEAQKIRVVEA